MAARQSQKTGIAWQTARRTRRTCYVGWGGFTRPSPHASAPWRCASLWSRRIPSSRSTARALARRTSDSGRCDATWKTRPEQQPPGSARAHYDANKSLDGEHTFFLACCHAGLAGLAGRPGSGVSAGERADQAEKAMAVLRQAVTMGYRNPDACRTESALDPLRDRPDFRLLLLDLGFSANPFARDR